MNQTLEIVQVEHSDATTTNVLPYLRVESWTSTHCTYVETSATRPAFMTIPLGPVGGTGKEVTT